MFTVTFAQIREVFESLGWRYDEEFSHGVGLFVPDKDYRAELYLTVKTMGTINSFRILRGDNKEDALRQFSDYNIDFRILSLEHVKVILACIE